MSASTEEEHLAEWLRFADGLRRYFHVHPYDRGLRVTVGGESVEVTMESIFAITEMAQRAVAATSAESANLAATAGKGE